MQIKVDTNLPAVQQALQRAASQVPYATAVALNKTAQTAKERVQADMRTLFDRPTPWVLNSLRVKRATKQTQAAELAFKDINSATSAKTMVAPHVHGGPRAWKAMEGRLLRAGLIPAGYSVVPGESARLDAYGNMTRGQISQILNVLGTYREAGYNKANAATRARLAKGGLKSSQYGQYGFTYTVIPVQPRSSRARHLAPGVYQRIATGFGSSLKPALMFVRQARYRPVLPFDATVQRTAQDRFAPEFVAAFDAAMRTAIPRQQGSLL